MEDLTANIHIDPSIRCLFIKGTGTLTKTNSFELADLAREDIRYENDFDVLSDLSDCTIEISPEVLRQLAIYIDQKWATQKKFVSAFIVNGPLNHGLARIYGAYSSTRVVEPVILNSQNLDVKTQIKTVFDFPDDYQLPEFLGY